MTTYAYAFLQVTGHVSVKGSARFCFGKKLYREMREALPSSRNIRISATNKECDCGDQLFVFFDQSDECIRLRVHGKFCFSRKTDRPRLGLPTRASEPTLNIIPIQAHRGGPPAGGGRTPVGQLRKRFGARNTAPGSSAGLGDDTSTAALCQQSGRGRTRRAASRRVGGCCRATSAHTWHALPCWIVLRIAMARKPLLQFRRRARH